MAIKSFKGFSKDMTRPICGVVDRYHPLHDRGPVHSNKSLKDIEKETVALAGRQEMARTAEAEGGERA